MVTYVLFGFKRSSLTGIRATNVSSNSKKEKKLSPLRSK